MITKLIYDDLINCHNIADSKEIFFSNAFKKLIEKGFVEETFLQAILEREEEYPTGLNLNEVSIAIPHTDAAHIKKPFIFINRIINNDLDFIQMGTDSEVLQPEYIIILGIKKPTEQVELLSELLELFGKDSFLSKLSLASNSEEVKEAFIESV